MSMSRSPEEVSKLFAYNRRANARALAPIEMLDANKAYPRKG